MIHPGIKNNPPDSILKVRISHRFRKVVDISTHSFCEYRLDKLLIIWSCCRRQRFIFTSSICINFTKLIINIRHIWIIVQTIYCNITVNIMILMLNLFLVQIFFLMKGECSYVMLNTFVLCICNRFGFF